MPLCALCADDRLFYSPVPVSAIIHGIPTDQSLRLRDLLLAANYKNEAVTPYL